MNSIFCVFVLKQTDENCDKTGIFIKWNANEKKRKEKVNGKGTCNAFSSTEVNEFK